MINAFAPSSSAEDEKVEQFYDIEKAMADSDSKYRITTEDVTAKIETKTKEGDFKSLGAFEIGKRNEKKHKLVIANTPFQRKKRHQKQANKTKAKQNKTKKPKQTETNKQTKNPKQSKKEKNPQTNKKTDAGLGSHALGKQETK